VTEEYGEGDFATPVGALVAADDYFTNDNGEYEFAVTSLRDAHEWCRSRVEHAMGNNRRLIVVHNTFIKHWEMEPYLLLARKYGYEIEVRRCTGKFGNNGHNVPQEIIDRHWDTIEDFNGEIFVS
jgi:hypothetical protein